MKEDRNEWGKNTKEGKKEGERKESREISITEVGEIAQRVRGPEFNSQQLHGGSQSSRVGADDLFWHKGIYANRALIYMK